MQEQSSLGEITASEEGETPSEGGLTSDGMHQGDVQLAENLIDQRADLIQGQREALGKAAPGGRPWEQQQPQDGFSGGDFLSFFCV